MEVGLEDKDDFLFLEKNCFSLKVLLGFYFLFFLNTFNLKSKGSFGILKKMGEFRVLKCYLRKLETHF